MPSKFQWTFLLTCAAMFLSGCKARSPVDSQLSSTIVLKYDEELGMRPGVGLDTIKYDTRGECITHEGLTEILTKGQEASYSIQLIENHRQLLSALDIDAAAQLRAAADGQSLKASEKMKFGLSTNFGISRYSVYLLATGHVQNGSEFLKNPKLSSEIRARFPKDKPGNFDEFRRVCGDSFVTGATTGGEFHALIEISNASDAMDAKLKTSYRKKSSKKADLYGLLSAVRGRKDLRFRSMQRGGLGQEQKPVKSAEEVIDRLDSLAESVLLSAHPSHLTATITDYATILDYFDLGFSLTQNQIEERLDRAERVIGRLAHSLSELQDLKSNIEYVLAHPKKFSTGAETLVNLSNALKAIDERLRKITQAHSACSRNLDNCAVPDGTNGPDISLPPKKKSLADLRRETIKIVTTISSIDRNSLSDHWGNPPECYLKVLVGHDTSQWIPIYRSPTTFGDASVRCNNLQRTLKVPIETVRNIYRKAGIDPGKGRIKIQLFEDDAWWDYEFGAVQTPFRNILQKPVLTGIHNDAISLDIGYEREF